MIDRPTVAPLPSRAPACVGALFFVPLPARRRYLGAEPGPAGASRTGTRERDPAGRSRAGVRDVARKRHYNVLRRAGRARLHVRGGARRVTRPGCHIRLAYDWRGATPAASRLRAGGFAARPTDPTAAAAQHRRPYMIDGAALCLFRVNFAAWGGAADLRCSGGDVPTCLDKIETTCRDPSKV